MKPVALSYMPVGSGPGGKPSHVVDVIVLVVGIAMVLYYVVPKGRSGTETWIDPVTGSAEKRVIGFFGRTWSNGTTVSPLEQRLVKSHIGWTRQWQYLCGVHGGAIGCAGAPPIYFMRPFLQDFVNSSTDPEVQSFIQTMQTGTPAAQESAINAIEDKLLGS